MINLRDASFFLRLYQTQNLTLAAKILDISPSTLSRIISKLEEQIGATLCIRDQKGVEITKEGHLFAAFVKKTLDNYQDLKLKIGNLKNNYVGTINLYCSVTASFVFIPNILSEMQLELPNLKLNLTTGDPANALSKLDHDDIDFVIAPIDDTKLNDDIAYVHLTTFPLVLIDKTLGFNTNKISCASLGTKPFIMCAHGLLQDKVKDFLVRENIHLNDIQEIAGHESMVCMSALGFGHTIVPKLVVTLSPYASKVTMYEDERFGMFKVCLCYKKENLIKNTEKLSLFINLVQKIAPSFSN